MMDRRAFLRSACAGLLACAALPPLLARESVPAPAPAHRGGRVGWARLVTPAGHWRRHASSDSTLSEFIREHTTLNMDPEWRSADPADVEDLCRYPFLFSTGLRPIRERAPLANLAEYLRRGGFLLVDSCINRSITPDPDAFLADNTAVFRELLPETRVATLPAGHPVYSCYFQTRERPPHTFHDNVFDPAWARHGLYGVFAGERLVSAISLAGLQCGWDRMIAPPGHPEECMRMVVNLYVHAMTAS